MMAIPASMAMRVPNGPATGRNVVPGITNIPHPTMTPKAMPQTSRREMYFEIAESLSCSIPISYSPLTR